VPEVADSSAPAGLGTKRLALHGRHVRLGARFAPFAGWEMPLQYSGIVSEHEAVRTRAGVFDVSHLGRTWLSGQGATAALRRATTYAVQKIPERRAHYSLYCNTGGGIEDDIFIYRLGPERWLVIHNAANAEADFQRLAGLSGGMAQDVTAETVMLAVQGPQALGVLERLLGPPFEGIQQHECREIDWRGSSITVARTGYTGEDGAECAASPEAGGQLWDALLDAGVEPAGLGARDTLRLEAALPLHGADIDPTTNPFEAGLGWAVSLDDGHDFIGRDALAQAKASPLSRRLACLRSPERAVFRAGYPVVGPGGQPLAELTSGGFSPTLRCGIGLAYLPPPLARPGATLGVQVRQATVPVEVVRRPFYRRSEA
jgi:aminomethyltransferase